MFEELWIYPQLQLLAEQPQLYGPETRQQPDGIEQGRDYSRAVAVAGAAAASVVNRDVL